MFTYIDPSVRERLVASGKLFRINKHGELVPPDRSAGQAGSISILGPIPLPLHLNGARYVVDWYACVRNTELSKIEEIAALCDVGLIDGSKQRAGTGRSFDVVRTIGESTQ